MNFLFASAMVVLVVLVMCLIAYAEIKREPRYPHEGGLTAARVERVQHKKAA